MYKQYRNLDGSIANAIQRLSDNACIPLDPANTDYQAYLKYIEQGGLVLPADATADAGAGTDEVTP
jgi:hypothetical protein